MLRQRFTHLFLAALAVLALAAATADAAPGRGGSRGGYGGGSRGGYSGYRGGYGGGYRGGYGGYGGYGYGGYGGYRGYGYGLYPGLGLGPGLGYGLGSGLGYGGYSYGSYPSVTYSTPAYVSPPIVTQFSSGTVIPSETVIPASGTAIQTTSGYTPDQAAQDNLAHVRVRVPANAEVWFEGEKTAQSGTLREFASPALKPGHNYVYTVRARWMEASGPVEQSREVNVQANATADVDFRALPPAEKLPAQPRER